MDTTVASVLINNGIAGIGLLVLGAVIRILWSEIQRLNKVVYELQEARRIDAKENLDKVVEPLTTMGTSIKFISDKLVVAKGNK